MPSESTRRIASWALTVVLASIVVWGLAAGDAAPRDRVEALGSRIKCPVCQGESITDSPAGFAKDMVSFVEEKIDEGWTDEEIIVYLEGRFPGIRLDPRLTGATLALWALPIVVIAGGAFLMRSRTTRDHLDESVDV